MTKGSVRAFLLLLVLPASSLGATSIPAEPRDLPGWQTHHESNVRQARLEKLAVVFLGDSITYHWRDDGILAWRRNFAALKAANFGVNGDGVHHLLWRVQHGELASQKLRVVVVLIGTNNLRNHSVEEISATHSELVAEIRKRQPRAKILLLAIFPRVDPWSAKFQDKIIPLNKGLAQLADGKLIHFLDLGPRFRANDGGVSPTVMRDGLHLTEKGYGLWAGAMLPVLRRLLR